jgi:hypothetical protein
MIRGSDRPSGTASPAAPDGTVNVDPRGFRARAARLRHTASQLAAAGRRAEAGLRDHYTAIVTEYDILAIELERLADDLR